MFRWWPLILWLIYFILPFDLFPDTFPGIGWSEDFLLLALVYWLWKKKKQQGTTNGSDRFRTGREQTSSSAGQEQHSDSAGRPRSQTRDPYKVLGLERPASLQEIKQAYRLQASRYHPDKVSHLGEEFQTLAKEKFQEIQQAYERLMRESKAA